jgi:phosphoribosylanthranilate isomerase
MTKIKICGIRTLKDAIAAIDAGADYLGFNFYPPSPRSISLKEGTELARSLDLDYPKIFLVGVFVNMSVRQIHDILISCYLDYAQLHGDESPEDVNSFGNRGFKAFRGIPNEETLERYEIENYPNRTPALLVDASIKGLYGGSGVTADWNGAAELAKKYPLLLAGGLTPKNVAEAVRQVRPWGVDVASGVESAPGEKDASKMKAFVRAVQSESRD